MENTLLNLIPAAYLPEIHLSQYDVGRTITFTLKDGSSDYSVPSGASVKVKATKPSGFGFEVACTFNGGTVTLVTTDTMTPENGRFPAELSIVSGNTTIGTSNFIFNIERSPHPEGTIDGDAETIIPELTLLVERIEAAADSVDEDTQTVTDAKAEVLQAKADTLQAKADTLSARDESVSAKDLAVSSAQTSVEASQRAEQLVGSVETKADAIVKSASGEVASFSDGGNGLLVKSLNVSIVPKQSGSGDPSPSNVRTISGVDTVGVTRAGKNLLNLPTYEEFITCPLVGNYYSYAIKVKPNTSYYLSVSYTDGYDPSGKYVYLLLTKNPSGNNPWVAVAHHSGDLGGAVTSSADGYLYLRLSKGDSAYVHYPNIRSHAHAQLEEGTSATAYEPYEGESKSISLGQTVYGGTLEVMSGKLSITKALIDMGALNWSYSATRVAFDVQFPTDASITNQDIISSIFKYGGLINSASEVTSKPDATIWRQRGNRSMFVKDSRYTDASAFKTAMSGQTLVYELATPTEITLTPTEVKTLLGNNNIFADSGSVEVEYRADTTLAYNELLSLIASLS